MSHEQETGVDRLWAYLTTTQLGPVADSATLERLLAACWDEFTGDDGGMEGRSC